MSLRLGVPSKGRLMEKAFAWFGAHGIVLSRSGSEREYAAEVHGIEGWNWFCYPQAKYQESFKPGASIWV